MLKTGALGTITCSSSVVGELLGMAGLTRIFLGTGSGAVGGFSASDTPESLFLSSPCGRGPRVKMRMDGSPGKQPGMQLSLAAKAELVMSPILDDRYQGLVLIVDADG
jgi:hypothetical protein